VSAGTPAESIERSDSSASNREERFALADSAAPMQMSTSAHGRDAHATKDGLDRVHAPFMLSRYIQFTAGSTTMDIHRRCRHDFRS
jgi:hypothetical protein